MTMNLLYMNNRYILTYIKTMTNFFLTIIQDHYQIAQQKKTEKKVEEIKEEKPTECSSTNNIYQKIPKEPQVQKEGFAQNRKTNCFCRGKAFN